MGIPAARVGAVAAVQRWAAAIVSSSRFKRPPSVPVFAFAPFSSLPSTTPHHDNLPAIIPIDFSVSSRIEGEESNVAFVNLSPGQVLRAESGAMIFMTEGIEMDTKLAGASNAFSRFLTGQNVFLTDFRYQGAEGEGTIALGTDFPSKIIRLNLQDHPDSSLICQRGAYLASNPNVDIQMEMSHSLTAGFFGGQGFILQKLTGEGDVLIKAGGTLVQRILQEGEVLRMTSGSVVAFETSCQYNVQMMPGVKNVMFGGEGLFVTTLSGPGRVWLQGMPPDRMIAEIARRVPAGSGLGFGVPLGVGGGSGGAGGGAGGGAEDAGAAGEGDAAAAGAGEGAMAAASASDAAIDADRQATVASSSSMDPESPQALFGDVAAKNAPSSSTERLSEPTFGSSSPSSGTDDSTSFSTSDSDGSSVDSFGDDQSFQQGASHDGGFGEGDPASSSSSSNNIFGDFFGTGPGQGPADGELFGDTPSSAESGGGGGGFLSTLWDLFTGGGDD